MKNTNKGYDAMTGLYISRYYANKAKGADEVVVKVCGGYKLMSVMDARIWKMQK